VRRRKGRPVPLEAAILGVFVAERLEGIHGFALAKLLADATASALTAHGTLYRALERMESAGWLRSDWEDPAIGAGAGRPQRRLYWITAEGRAVLAAEHAEEPAPGAPRGWIAP
jgi:PadR family transcriptional regulator PadR